MIDELIVSAQRSYFFAEYALYDSTSYLVGTLLPVLSCPIDRGRNWSPEKWFILAQAQRHFYRKRTWPQFL